MGRKSAPLRGEDLWEEFEALLGEETREVSLSCPNDYEIFLKRSQIKSQLS